jgi:hypothetical protein
VLVPDFGTPYSDANFRAVRRVASRWILRTWFGPLSLTWLLLVLVDLAMHKRGIGLPSLSVVTPLDSVILISPVACIAWVMLPIELVWCWRLAHRCGMSVASGFMAKTSVEMGAWKSLSTGKIVWMLALSAGLLVFWLSYLASSDPTLINTPWTALKYLFETWFCFQAFVTLTVQTTLFLALAMKGWK